MIHTGETQEQGGQAGGMSICTDEYKADPRLILSYHVVPGKWLLQGGTTGGDVYKRQYHVRLSLTIFCQYFIVT